MTFAFVQLPWCEHWHTHLRNLWRALWATTASAMSAFDVKHMSQNFVVRKGEIHERQLIVSKSGMLIGATLNAFTKMAQNCLKGAGCPSSLQSEIVTQSLLSQMGSAYVRFHRNTYLPARHVEWKCMSQEFPKHSFKVKTNYQDNFAPRH